MRRTWNGRVTAHKGRLLIVFKNETGKWVQRSTGLADLPENYPAAERLLAEVRSKMEALHDATDGTGGTLTIARWGARWLRDRERQVRDYKNDGARLRLHVFPVIGGMRLEDVRPRHLVELVDRLKKEHAPRTVRNVYSVIRALFRDARIADVLQGADPCILTHRQLGRVRDKKTGWRATAVFTRDELVTLLSDPRVPEDRRVFYGLLGLGMLRLGEASGLRWSAIQAADPLHRMALDVTYEDDELKTAGAGAAERWMPVHPTLAAMLAEWRLRGWAAALGHAPRGEDLVCPVTPDAPRKGRRLVPGAVRNRHYVWKRAQRDLDALGLRRRRVHDLRRTGISLAQDDGADGAILRWGTHAPPREVFDLYTTLQWSTLCREVAKLRIVRPQGFVARPTE